LLAVGGNSRLMTIDVAVLTAAFLRRVLAHPLTASLDLDNPATTALRKNIIASKPFLKAIYDEWYTTLASAVPIGKGQIVEIGSGAGYCSQFIPDLISSEVFICPDVRLVLDAQQMPFANGSLRAIVMTNVLHHMPRVTRFLAEARRCLRPGGKILMIEPWVTRWSTFIYTHFHHEPFNPHATDWSFVSEGPLSGANGALPWILFVRDRQKFELSFPDLIIEHISPFLPFRYVVSGGVGMRSLTPGFTHGAWVGLERLLRCQMANLAMFAFISVRRR
jgi:SAM-dependent methyltransferase